MIIRHVTSSEILKIARNQHKSSSNNTYNVTTIIDVIEAAINDRESLKPIEWGDFIKRYEAGNTPLNRIYGFHQDHLINSMFCCDEDYQLIRFWEPAIGRVSPSIRVRRLIYNPNYESGDYELYGQSESIGDDGR